MQGFFKLNESYRYLEVRFKGFCSVVEGNFEAGGGGIKVLSNLKPEISEIVVYRPPTPEPSIFL